MLYNKISNKSSNKLSNKSSKWQDIYMIDWQDWCWMINNPEFKFRFKDNFKKDTWEEGVLAGFILPDLFVSRIGCVWTVYYNCQVLAI